MIWRCNKKYEVKVKKSCENKHIDDRVLYQAFVGVFNSLVKNKDYFMQKWKSEDRDVLKKYKVGQFIKIIGEADKLKEFDIDLQYKVIEKMIVFEGNRVIAGLLEGTEIEVVIE